ncbi:DUF6378 domain-containing protein [Acinetobacter baumannii]
MSIQKTLQQRGERYGDFAEVAATTQALMAVIDSAYNSEQLDDSMKTSLFMICNKMARIVNGDPNYIDNWHDIAGYATLVEQELAITKRDGEQQ